MRKLDFNFFKKPEFWVTTIIAIILTFIGGFMSGIYVYNNENGMINSPNSVQSINQQGGITTGNLNIESPKREINQEFINELNKYLPKSKDKKITITSILGDAESFQLAKDLKKYLESQGWNVDGINQALYIEPIVGIEVDTNESGNVDFIIGTKP